MWLDEDEEIIKPRLMQLRERMLGFLEERKIDDEIQDHGQLIATALSDHGSNTNIIAKINQFQ